MKKLNIFILIINVLFFSTNLIAQSTTTNHFAPVNSTNTFYLGWEDNDIPLQFRTTNQRRMELAKSENVTVLGNTFNHGGFLGLSDEQGFFSNNSNAGPYSMFHINGGNGSGGWSPWMYGFRSWMKYGTLISANHDLAYFGIKNNLGQDNTEAVISWSDNSSSSNSDYLVFKFTASESSNPNYAQNTEDGLEVARFAPNGNVGIGDFSNNGFGLNEDPTQKLDVDGTARMRQMSEEEDPDVVITGMEQNAAGDYEFHYSDPSIFGGEDCRWLTTPFGIATGYTAPDLCNNQNVGIGDQANADAKLFVRYEPGNTTLQKIGNSTLILSPYNLGTRIAVQGLSRYGKISYGGKFESLANGYNYGGTFSLGVYAYGREAKTSFGVYGIGQGSGTSIGVYGEKQGGSPFGVGGYFVGGISTTGPSIVISDETFKENISEMEDAMSIINNIHPKTYNFKTEEYNYMGLSEGTHSGVIAQELQEVYPSAVHPSIFPEKYDSLGNMVHAEIEYLGVDYTELIPLLIQATKEQQVEMDAKNDRIDDLEAQIQALAEMVAQCCADQDKTNHENQGSNDIQIDKNLLKQNTPNPFDLNTSIEYYLAQAGTVTIKVTNTQGQLIDVLVSEDQDQGAHKIQWSAKNITRGVYYYSLNINGEEMVKRMVKL